MEEECIKKIEEFEDILYLERPKSLFPKMTGNSRASQFLPFDALDGFSESVSEVIEEHS